MLDWEENLFLGLKAAYGRLVLRPRERRRDHVAARLRDRRNALLLFAQCIAGRPLSLFETDDPRLGLGDRVFLPPEFSVAQTRDANVLLFEIRVLCAALAVRDGWNAGGGSVERWVGRYRGEFPALAEKVAQISAALPAEVDLWSLVGTLPASLASADPAAVAAPVTSQAEASRVTTEIQGRGRAEVSVLPAREDDGPGADMPMHTFEKVETVEEYTGLSRKSDDEDELGEHAEGLSELRMTQVLRSAERPKSIYRADLILDGPSMEVEGAAEEGGIPYPEWNHGAGRYRPNWCHVREEVAGEGSGEWAEQVALRHRRLIRQLRCQMASLTSEWLRERRQPFGDEFDVDAVVDAEVERRTGHSPPESIYLDRRRDVHDIAALILLDESYSTDAWIEDRRVMDIIRESVFCVGEVLDSDVESFAVAAFSSNTRRSCQFKMVKGFDQSWPAARGRLASLEPRGYTRIGPALRHAQELLARERASRRMVILLTDGRPCDYDRYEGLYGIKDVKKAIEVGNRSGIHTHAFAIEKQAAEFFPQMFTKHDYDILPHPDRLARTMCRLFGRLLAM